MLRKVIFPVSTYENDFPREFLVAGEILLSSTRRRRVNERSISLATKNSQGKSFLYERRGGKGSNIAQHGGRDTCRNRRGGQYLTRPDKEC